MDTPVDTPRGSLSPPSTTSCRTESSVSQYVCVWVCVGVCVGVSVCVTVCLWVCTLPRCWPCLVDCQRQYPLKSNFFMSYRCVSLDIQLTHGVPVCMCIRYRAVRRPNTPHTLTHMHTLFHSSHPRLLCPLHWSHLPPVTTHCRGQR